MYSVAIADDEVCIREGLRDLVEWHKLGFSLVGAFEDGEMCIRDRPHTACRLRDCYALSANNSHCQLLARLHLSPCGKRIGCLLYTSRCV